MAANHLIRAASCGSNISARHCYSLRSAHLEDDVQLKSQSYENNSIDDYAANCVISEAISDQSSSGNASNCGQKQVEIKSRSLIKDVFNSRKGKQGVPGSAGYGEVVQLQQLQEVNMESDPRHSDAGAVYAGADAKEGDRNPCDEGIGAAFGVYAAGDRGGSIGGVNVSLSAVARNCADSISRADTCTAVGGGDRHSSSSGGVCVATGTDDRGCSRSAANAKLIDSARAVVKAGLGYAAPSAFAESADNAAEVENAAGSAGCAAAAGKMRRRKKFVGVRQRPSGRWVAEIKDTTQKIRMWLGTFDTAEDAARAYDEAACLLRGSNTRTNFIPLAPSSPSSSPLASRLAHMLRARQNQNIISESSSPSSPPSAAATKEPHSSNPLSSSPSNPLISSSFSHNRNPNYTMQRSNDSTKHYPNCANLKQNGKPHTNQFPHNSFHNPYRKTYGNRQQHTPMSNQGYSLQLLHPRTEAQSNLFEFMNTKSSKASSSPLWKSSKCESESSDSDPSPPHADYFVNSIHKRPRTQIHDHFQVLPLARYKAGFASFHGCSNDMASYMGKEISGELSHAHVNSKNEDMDWDEHKQIFVRDKNLISAEDIETLTHDQHLTRSSHSYHHNYRGGGFMDALMGINDDIILNPSEHMESMASSNYNHNHNVSPFDFNVEASLGSSMMEVDEFPLISELSGKLEEAEGALNRYVNLHDEEGSNHSSSSSSNVIHDSAHDNAKLGLHVSGNLDGNLVGGINSELEMKRMRFERRASASLYALNGVHEMAMKQTPSHNPGTNYLAGNSTSTSFNFLSTSPSYMLSSPWKQPSSASSTTTSTCDDSSAFNASNVNGAVINTCDDSSALNASNVISTPSLVPSSNSSLSSCPSDTNIASNNNSTLTFSNMGSDTSNGTTNSSTNKNSSDAQSQEAAMWNSWDLAPLCTLVA